MDDEKNPNGPSSPPYLFGCRSDFLSLLFTLHTELTARVSAIHYNIHQHLLTIFDQS